MANLGFKKVQAAVLAAGNVIYTVPGGTNAIIKEIEILNISGAQQTIKIGQGGLANANLILNPTTLQAGEYGSGAGTITMAAGDTIQAQCDADNGYAITLELMEYTG